LSGGIPLSKIPPRRLHVPWIFDRTLEEFGFRKIGHNYFRFSPFPVPCDSLLEPLCGWAGRHMEKLTVCPIGFIGGGYLVLASKT
jgi:hypothetical protein